MAQSGSLDPWPLSLAPHLVNNDCVGAELTGSVAHGRHEVYVTAEITYRTVHVCHQSLISTWVTLCGTPGALAAATLGLCWSDTIITLYEVVLELRYGSA